MLTEVARGALALAVLAAFGCGSAPAKAPWNRAPHKEGEPVSITGVVTDTGSRPVEGVEVVFRASREKFDYLRLRKREGVERDAATRTSAAGAFAIEWPWDPGFNQFDLFLGVTVGRPGGEEFHVLAHEELTGRIRAGGPVVVSVELENVEFLATFREFLASLESDAQREIYRHAGKPDKVQRRILPEHVEVDWWYFSLGKVYRFRDGALDSTEDFEPVLEFEQSETPGS